MTYEVVCLTPFGPHVVAEHETQTAAWRDAADRNNHSTARYTVREKAGENL